MEDKKEEKKLKKGDNPKGQGPCKPKKPKTKEEKEAQRAKAAEKKKIEKRAGTPWRRKKKKEEEGITEESNEGNNEVKKNEGMDGKNDVKKDGVRILRGGNIQNNELYLVYKYYLWPPYTYNNLHHLKNIYN